MLKLTNKNENSTVLITIPSTREILKLKPKSFVILKNLYKGDEVSLKDAYKPLGVVGEIIKEEKKSKVVPKKEEIVKDVETKEAEPVETKEAEPVEKKPTPKRKKLSL